MFAHSEKIVGQIFSGIANGTIYGLLALSIVFLYRANKLFNLASTEIATFFAYGMFHLLKWMSYFAALSCTLLLALIGGMCLHFGIMRILTERKVEVHSTESIETVITIGIFTVLNSLSAFLNSEEPEKLDTPFAPSLISVASVNISSYSVFVLGSAILIIVGLFLFLRRTKLGLVMETTAQSVDSARLRGIDTSNILALSWGIGAVISAFAGILIAPILFLTPSMLTNVFCYSLIAVIIGGTESLLGAVVGGIMVGIVENLSTNISFIGPDLKFLSVFALLLVVLVIRPRGLWGREEHRRV